MTGRTTSLQESVERVFIPNSCGKKDLHTRESLEKLPHSSQQRRKSLFVVCLGQLQLRDLNPTH